jgi:hypothetical protein
MHNHAVNGTTALHPESMQGRCCQGLRCVQVYRRAAITIALKRDAATVLLP